MVSFQRLIKNQVTILFDVPAIAFPQTMNIYIYIYIYIYIGMYIYIYIYNAKNSEFHAACATIFSQMNYDRLKIVAQEA